MSKKLPKDCKHELVNPNGCVGANFDLDYDECVDFSITVSDAASEETRAHIAALGLKSEKVTGLAVSCSECGSLATLWFQPVTYEVEGGHVELL